MAADYRHVRPKRFQNVGLPRRRLAAVHHHRRCPVRISRLLARHKFIADEARTRPVDRLARLMKSLRFHVPNAYQGQAETPSGCKNNCPPFRRGPFLSFPPPASAARARTCYHAISSTTTRNSEASLRLSRGRGGEGDFAISAT